VRRGPPPGGPGSTVGASGGGGGIFGGIGSQIPAQDVAQVSTKWPAGNIDLRMSNYMCQAQQKWTIEPVANAGGYPGSPYFKITIAGTNRTLAATEYAELVVLPDFIGGPEQLWRIDQLADGSWRIMPRAVPNSKDPLVLSAVGSSFATLAKFDRQGEKQRWLLKTP
jgi:arabinan endo-1,5-alpha-L-arabinosidase